MSTVSTKCTLCGLEVDYDETRGGVCIDCLYTGFKLTSYFEATDQPKKTTPKKTKQKKNKK